jgi:hypothetical protein
MARTPKERRWLVYMIAAKSAVRLGEIVAPDNRDAAIARAIEHFGVTDPERQKRVAVRPIAEPN